MSTIIQILRGTTAKWLATKHLLRSGELGLNTDTNELVVGDGLSTYPELDPYLPKSTIQTLLEAAGGGSGGGDYARTEYVFDFNAEPWNSTTGIWPVFDLGVFGVPVPPNPNGPTSDENWPEGRFYLGTLETLAGGTIANEQFGPITLKYQTFTGTVVRAPSTDGTSPERFTSSQWRRVAILIGEANGGTEGGGDWGAWSRVEEDAIRLDPDTKVAVAHDGIRLGREFGTAGTVTYTEAGLTLDGVPLADIYGGGGDIDFDTTLVSVPTPFVPGFTLTTKYRLDAPNDNSSAFTAAVAQFQVDNQAQYDAAIAAQNQGDYSLYYAYLADAYNYAYGVAPSSWTTLLNDLGSTVRNTQIQVDDLAIPNPDILRWRGEFAAQVTYYFNDLVRENDVVYRFSEPGSSSYGDGTEAAGLVDTGAVEVFIPASEQLGAGGASKPGVADFAATDVVTPYGGVYDGETIIGSVTIPEDVAIGDILRLHAAWEASNPPSQDQAGFYRIYIDGERAWNQYVNDFGSDKSSVLEMTILARSESTVSTSLRWDQGYANSDLGGGIERSSIAAVLRGVDIVAEAGKTIRLVTSAHSSIVGQPTWTVPLLTLEHIRGTSS